jgi:hypothetical protein
LDASDAAAPSNDAAAEVPPAGAGGCAALFRQDLLPTFEIEITPDEWARLVDEFRNVEANQAAGVLVNPYHPVVFRDEGETRSDAQIRLKGSSSWEAVAMKPNGKMQFVIKFNGINKNGRFRGRRALELDMPKSDPTYLRSRLAAAFMRDLGLPAPCANNARLVINGAYYGLYTNLERADRELVERLFPDFPAGDLWDSGEEPETNEDTADRARLARFWAATDVTSMAAVMDLEEAVSEWAAEAMLPSADGYWAGKGEFYLFDHPLRGFIWLPRDLDSTLDAVEDPAVDPASWWMVREKPVSPGPHYEAVMADPAWRARYVAAVRRALAGYDVAALEARVDAWSAQIATAAAEDPTRPFTVEEHKEAVANQRAYFARRAAAVRAWLDAQPAPPQR